jgi:hypothetical protein
MPAATAGFLAERRLELRLALPPERLVAFLAVERLAGRFAAFLAPPFLAVERFFVAFLADFLAAGLLAVFLAADFFAAGFLLADFLAAGFLAAFFTVFLAVLFLAAFFRVPPFLAVAALRGLFLADFFGPGLVPSKRAAAVEIILFFAVFLFLGFFATIIVPPSRFGSTEHAFANFRFVNELAIQDAYATTFSESENSR